MRNWSKLPGPDPSLAYHLVRREETQPRDDAIRTRSDMIFITARFRVLPEHADRWPDLSREFTNATRSEPGCLWFDWSRGIEDPTEYVLVEAFRDQSDGAAHVHSEHFRTAQQTLPRYLAETPQIVNVTVPQDGWSELGEMRVSPPG
jgi:quinol monooxygenase YgiN